MMERALALTIDYVKQRKAFGKTIIEFQNTQFELADCKTEATVAKVFIDHCIERACRGRARHRDRLDGEILGHRYCSARWSTAACNCSAAMATWTNIRSRGSTATPACMRIYAGTNEIMKLLIARSL